MSRRATTETWRVEAFEQGAWFFARKVAVAPGYAWRDGDGGPYLTVAQIDGAVGVPYDARMSSPFRGAIAIHRELQHLYERFAPGPAESDQARLTAAIRDFANRHGDLGITPEEIPQEGSGSVRVGEPLGRWADAIANIGRLVTLWDLVRQRDVSRLGQQIAWQVKGQPVRFWSHSRIPAVAQARRARKVVPVAGGDALTWRVRDNWGESYTIVAGEVLRPELYVRWKRGEVVAAGEYVLSHYLNKALQGAISPQLMPLRAREAEGHICGRLVPTSLLNLAFVQLYLEVTGQHRFQPCQAPGCVTWIETTAARSDKRYCGSTCQKRAFRVRKTSR